MSRQRSYGAAAAIAEEHGALLRQQIATLSREPFREVLASLLGAPPTPAAIKKFAEKSPDRWAQAVAIMTKAAGYHEGVTGGPRNETNIYLQLQAKSDAEVLAELTNMLKALGVDMSMVRSLDPRNLIEGEVILEEAKPDE